jgi:hypothetical protein
MAICKLHKAITKIILLTFSFALVFVSSPANALECEIDNTRDMDYAHGVDRIGRRPPVGIDAVINDAINRFVCRFQISRQAYCRVRGLENAYNVNRSDFLAGCREAVNACYRRQNVMANLESNLDFEDLFDRVAETAAMDIAGTTQIGSVIILSDVLNDLPCVDDPRDAGRLMCRTIIQVVDEKAPDIIDNSVGRVLANTFNPVEMNCPAFRPR